MNILVVFSLMTVVVFLVAILWLETNTPKTFFHALWKGRTNSFGPGGPTQSERSRYQFHPGGPA